MGKAYSHSEVGKTEPRGIPGQKKVLQQQKTIRGKSEENLMQIYVYLKA